MKMKRGESWLASAISAIKVDVPEIEQQEPLSEGEWPECPYCERTLGTAPGQGGIAWKCVQHGTFPASEFEPNILRAMQSDVEGITAAQLLLWIPIVVPMMLVFSLLDWLKNLGGE